MRRRLHVTKNYQNIIILVLILAILFFFGKLILNRDSFTSTTNEVNSEMKVDIGVKGEIPEQNKFLVQAIHYALPSGDGINNISIGGSAKHIATSFIDNMFSLDLKNPVTFVQAQFPASKTENVRMVMGDEDFRREIPREEETTRDIYFIEVEKEGENSIAVGPAPNLEDMDSYDEDDLGEMWEGIYQMDDENVIDSLRSSDLSSVLKSVTKPEKVEFQEGKPHILIYHTHGTESYYPASEGNYHTLRKEYSVITVAEIMAEELEKRGYNVIHDTTYHDYPSYSGSYSRSLETARKILKENPSIKVVLDVHRDGYDHIETNPNRARLVSNNQATINDETSTKFQFVIGPAAPNRSEVETFANYVKAISDSKYPGFSKPILVKPYGQFNQFLSNHYALLEVGSNANTIEEAKRSAVYLADVFADALDHIKK
ncbi:MAG: stage II sporulation protein P [Clostridiaceae bacterium]|nr:stage II sporulation protein P [Clostridiaceae bacterium]